VKEYERVEGPAKSLAPAGDPSGNDIGSSSAMCAPGTRVISGGFSTVTGGGAVFYNAALTTGRVGWAVGAVNNLTESGTVQAFAYCVSGGRAPSPATRGKLADQRAAGRRQIQAMIDRYRVLRASQTPGAGVQ
jgi:hypothetical protein